MDGLRKATNHVVLKIILGLIALSFLLTSIDINLVNINNDYVAKVNGQLISHTQLEQAVQNERHHQQKSMGDRFSQFAANKSYMQQIRQQMLSQLINEVLLYQYAETLGLIISDAQIKQFILAIPAFHTNGQFSNEKYRMLIMNMGLTPDQYAKLIRKELLTQKLLQYIDTACFLLPSEIDHLLSVAVQTRQVRLATFNINVISAKQTASTDEVKANYNHNKTLYMSPETFKVSYIRIDKAAIQASININEQEIQSWYDQHKDQFTEYGCKNYSIIRTKTKNKAKMILAELQQGGDFSVLAKNYSTDILSAKNGGNIGWISDEDTINELQSLNLNEKNQLSGIIKSSTGYLIARLNAIEPTRLKALNAVHKTVEAKIKQEKATCMYHALQNKLNDAVSNDNQSLALAETVSGIKAQQTDWFTRDNVPSILNIDAIKQVLFDGSLLSSSGAPSGNSDIITVDYNCSFVVRIIGYKPEKVKPLDMVSPLVEQDVKRQKAQDQALIDAQKILVELKQGKGNKVLETVGLNFSTLQNFYSTSENNSLEQCIFALQQPKPGKSNYGIATDDHGNIVIVALDHVKPRKLDHLQYQQLINQLNQLVSSMTLDILLQNLRNDAKIKISTAIKIE